MQASIIILTVALLIDAAANIARMITVEIQYKRQSALMDRAEREHRRQVGDVVEGLTEVLKLRKDPLE